MAVIKPIENGRITSKYGQRILNGKPEFHQGIDIVGPKGCETKTPYKIRVDWIGESPSYGFRMWAEVLEGPHKGQFQIMAHHASLKSHEKGDILEAGTVIGIQGSTGYSFGDHLHLGYHSSVGRGTKSFEPKEVQSLYLD